MKNNKKYEKNKMKQGDNKMKSKVKNKIRNKTNKR